MVDLEDNIEQEVNYPEVLLQEKIENNINNRIKYLEEKLNQNNYYLEAQEQKEYSILQKFLKLHQEYNNIKEKIRNNEEVIAISSEDIDLINLLEEENNSFINEKIEVYEEYKKLLFENTEENIDGISLEIRCGTGGREAALFAYDLLEMYRKFAVRKNWKYKIDSLNKTPEGGAREAIIIINNKNAYSMLQYESGVHRVQRVPETESMGRIHTSTATVAVLPELEKIVNIEIDPKDISIDVYRASGAGGQHVNTTESAVRVTHHPTNTVVIQQDERSQHKNKEKAMSVLKERVLKKMIQNQQEEICRQRLTQIGKGERCEKIRTYNFPQDRVTDHRINYSVFNINGFLEGEEIEKICRKMQQLSSKTILEKYNMI